MKIPAAVRRPIAVLVLLPLAGAAQAVWAFQISIHGARPDFVLLTALLCSQFGGANESAAVGIGAGLLTAALAAPPEGGFGSLVVSRTLVCFCVGWLEERIFRDHAAISIALVAGGTMLAESLFYAFDPHFPVVGWARGVGLEIIYNVCLTIPLYLVVRACLSTRKTITTTPAS